eukprot:2861496-Rhodomonas_salina.2
MTEAKHVCPSEFLRRFGTIGGRKMIAIQDRAGSCNAQLIVCLMLIAAHKIWADTDASSTEIAASSTDQTTQTPSRSASETG